jgi:hypothetical protein
VLTLSIPAAPPRRGLSPELNGLRGRSEGHGGTHELTLGPNNPASWATRPHAEEPSNREGLARPDALIWRMSVLTPRLA